MAKDPGKLSGYHYPTTTTRSSTKNRKPCLENLIPGTEPESIEKQWGQCTKPVDIALETSISHLKPR